MLVRSLKPDSEDWWPKAAPADPVSQAPWPTTESYWPPPNWLCRPGVTLWPGAPVLPMAPFSLKLCENPIGVTVVDAQGFISISTFQINLTTFSKHKESWILARKRGSPIFESWNITAELHWIAPNVHRQFIQAAPRYSSIWKTCHTDESSVCLNLSKYSFCQSLCTAKYLATLYPL